MQYSIVFLAVAAAVVSAQDLSGLPSCAINCGTSNLSATKCSLTDSKCLCGDTKYQGLVEACVKKSCSKDDTCKAAQWAAKICNAAIPDGICGPPSTGGAAPTSPVSPPPSTGAPAPCYGDYCPPAQSSEAPAPSGSTGCDGSDDGSYGSGYGTPTTPTGGDTYGQPTGYGSSGAAPTDESAPCPCATQGGSYPAPAESSAAGVPAPAGGETPCPSAATGGYPAPASSSAAGVPVPAGGETPCPSAPAQESAPAASTPCPTLATRPYPPPVASGYPIPAPAASSAAAVPVPAYGGNNATTPAGTVPTYENSGNKMFTVSSLGAGLIAVAMVVAF